MTWESVEEKRSTAQRLSNLKHSGASIDMKNFTGRESGNVRDIIARRVGLGSGVTYEKGKAVVEMIDKELSIGDILQRGELLRMTLNEQSISAASNMLDKIQKAEEKARKKREQEEAERLRQQELARQRYLEAVKKAEHCTYVLMDHSLTRSHNQYHHKQRRKHDVQQSFSLTRNDTLLVLGARSYPRRSFDGLWEQYDWISPLDSRNNSHHK